MDIDSDGIEEVFLNNSLGSRLIFDYDDGIMYGYPFSGREMSYVSIDGSFRCSEAESGWSRINLSQGEYEMILTPNLDFQSPGAPQHYLFYKENIIELFLPDEFEKYQSEQIKQASHQASEQESGVEWEAFKTTLSGNFTLIEDKEDRQMFQRRYRNNIKYYGECTWRYILLDFNQDGITDLFIQDDSVVGSDSSLLYYSDGKIICAYSDTSDYHDFYVPFKDGRLLYIYVYSVTTNEYIEIVTIEEDFSTMNTHMLVIFFLTFIFIFGGKKMLPVVDGVSKREEQISDNNANYAPNPYKGHTEVADPWQYELFEIFRGAQAVTFDDTLDYEQDYSCLIAREEEELLDFLHEYKCKIMLPQATGNEPWTEQINAYYQGIMPKLIAEGDDIWNESFDDKDILWLGYYYEDAYKHENVINVVRSRNFYGYRPTVGWEPFVDLFSALDGSKLCLDDLFCVSRDDYLPVLQSSLLNATVCFSDGYNLAYDEDFKSGSQWGITKYFNDTSVAVTSFGLVFIYPTGMVDCMAAGTVFLTVSYEDLHGILNPIYFPD